MNLADVKGRARRFRHALDEESRPEDVNLVDSEGPSDEWPVGLKEAENTCNRDRVVGQCFADPLDLPLYAVDELRLVPSTDSK